MKKILLASACLLTLTACSMPNQNKQENKPKQNQSQSKAKKEEKVKTKTFSYNIPNGYSNKIVVYYQKNKILAFDFMAGKPTQEDEQNKSTEEINNIYQEELKTGDFYDKFSKLDGVTVEVKVSADRKTVEQIAHFDLSKANEKQVMAALGETSEDNLFKKLKEKPEDFFSYLLSQGFTEE
ncbi:hypothetical protein D8890_00305 [Streptococcus sanguinis]|uniref:DUF1307 domain-containing protein n=1 Tax=Streptococcus sanguinis TaxID=1305 RepID=UPI000F66C47D|nr:DUF1307 domain-containing protein [Streptococcus sanguinis]RSI06403.1 hypothetical protein D8890_00305 [Streptococcus sanguinis]